MDTRIQEYRRATLFLIVVIPVLLGSSAVEIRHAPTTKAEIRLGYAAKYDRVKESTSELIRNEMRKNDVTGLSIALVDDQRIVWAKGFGYADKRREIPAHPETIYKIGSITKLFTAIAIMQLAEQGKLDIDQPLQAYLPEFSMRSRFTGGKPITLRDLMTHHSGLPANFLKGMWSRQPAPFTDVVNLIRDEYVAYPPGLVYAYSNLGYTLLGHVVQKVSGREYASSIEESILRPLGMIHSGFSPLPDSSGTLSKAYYKGREFDEPSLRDIPTGGLYSSVLDLSHFMQMMFAQGNAQGLQIVKPETISEMLGPQNSTVRLDLSFRIGLGWMLSSLGDVDIQNAGPVAFQPGTTLAFHSQMVILPKYRIGVVVLSNSSTAGRVVNRVAAKALVLALEAKAGIKQPERQRPAESESALPDQVLWSYEGRYATIIDVVDIKKKSDFLVAQAMHRTLRLVPLVNGTLGVKYKLFGLFPISLGELDYVGVSHDSIDGHELLVAHTGNREFLIGEKIDPVPVSETWRKRTGEYVIDNLGDDFPLLESIDIRFDKGLLIADYSMPVLFKDVPGFGIEPLSDAEAVILGLGSGKGETIRAVSVSGREELYYSGYLLRKRE